MRKLLTILIIAVFVSNSFAYYQAEQGRWLSRDPLQTGQRYTKSQVLSEPLYTFVLNNPINSYDYMGIYTLQEASFNKYNKLHPRPQQPFQIVVWEHDRNNWFKNLTDPDMFSNWIEAEEADTKWRSSLPECPPCLSKKDKGFSSPKSSTWDKPHKVTNPDRFHPGGVWEIRTVKGNSYGSGNQCIYDANGKLITSGYGRGTADRMQASGKFATIGHWFNDSGHIGHDVNPFNLAYSLDENSLGTHVDQYIAVRPFLGPIAGKQ